MADNQLSAFGATNNEIRNPAKQGKPEIYSPSASPKECLMTKCPNIDVPDHSSDTLLFLRRPGKTGQNSLRGVI